MKYIYGFVFVVCLIALLVVYFQNIGNSMSVRFFNSYMNLSFFLIIYWFIAILIWISGFLFIRSILKGDWDVDDEFEL